jgi:hypothetical protein
MSDSWSREEVEAAVAEYFAMLDLELRQEPFNKAERNRQLQRVLVNRTRGSIERKHQNISAVLIEMGYPYIDGYKPLGNYQQLLRDVVEERTAVAADLNQALAVRVVSPANKLLPISDLLSIQVRPPARREEESLLYDKPRFAFNGTRRNYLEIESRNRSLGQAGEELVMKFEHERLWRAGERILADRIECVSETKGDHLGYDILSFETDGRERLIEVKTTRFGQMTPFFASRNEVDVSASNEAQYQLYRLFSFERQPRLFVLPGSLRNSCTLDPAQFTAMPIGS